MMLAKNLYKLSGIEYGTCSNTYALDWGEGIALFDAGTHDIQYDTMRAQLRRWGLADKPVTHVFLTHGHFDHAGNAQRFQQAGARIVVGEADAADYERIAELSEKLGQLQSELDAQTDEWAEASERLEEIEE